MNIFSILMAISSPSLVALAPALPATPHHAISRLHTPADFGDLTLVHARAALRNGKPERTLQLALEFTRNYPRHAKRHLAQLMAARAAIALKQPATALRALYALGQHRPELSDLIWHLRGLAYRQQHAWQPAADAWQRLIARGRSPFRPAARYSLGDAHYATRQYDTALKSYQQALRYAPRSKRASAAKFAIADIYSHLGRFDEAGKTFRVFAYHQPSSPLSGAAHERLKQLEAAQHLQPASMHTQLTRIDRYLQERSLEHAAQSLQQLSPIAAQDTANQQAIAKRRGILAYRQQKYAHAEQLFQQLLQTSSDTREQYSLYSWFTRSLLGQNKLDSAINTYLQLAQQNNTPYTSQFTYKAAWLAYDGGRYGQAHDLLNHYASQFPDKKNDWKITWHRGWTAYRLNKCKDALPYFEHLIEHTDSYAITLRASYWQARCFEQLAQPQRAHTLLRDIIYHAPHHYYGTLSKLRLRQLNGPTTLAQAPAAPPHPPEHACPLALPSPRPQAANSAHTHATSALQWNSPEGRRLQAFIALDMPRAAADTLRSIPTSPGHSPQHIAQVKAHLLTSLAQYQAALGLATQSFARTLAAPPHHTRPAAAFRFAYPRAFAADVQQHTKRFHISPLLIYAIMRQESAFNPTAQSWANARGLMQLIPSTNKRIAARIPTARTVPASLARSIEFGSWYLSALLRNYAGNLPLAIAAYNAGPQAVNRWLTQRPGRPLDVFIEEIPYLETRNYVRKVLHNLSTYQHLYAPHSPGLQLTSALPTESTQYVEF